MENELRDFFLTVANQPLYSSFYPILSRSADKYLDSLKKIPVTSKFHYYAKWLGEGLLFKLGRLEWPPPAYEADYKRNVSLFTEIELNDFMKKQRGLANVLDQIISGLPLSEVAGMGYLTRAANGLHTTKYFDFKNGDIEVHEYLPSLPKGADPVIKKPSDYRELEGIFQLACYALTLFLADGGAGRIKRCAHCNAFFSRDRNDERNRFCSDDCRNIHNQGQRKTDDGKAQRAAYMRGRRVVLGERRRAKKRAEELKRLMDGGHTRKQAEKLLNDVDA